MLQAYFWNIVPMSLLALFLYALDKLLAKGQGGRVPEAVLLTVTALGGGVGALLGTVAFHHKSNRRGKWYFWCVLVVSLLIQAWILRMLLGVPSGAGGAL